MNHLIMGPLQLSDHVVQIAELESKFGGFVKHVPVPHLLSSLAMCIPCSISCKRPIIHIKKCNGFLSSIILKVEVSYNDNIPLKLAYPRVAHGLPRLSKVINIRE